MRMTHSPAAATFAADEVVVVVPPLPGLIVTELPLPPAVVEPLRPPVPVVTVVELEPEVGPAVFLAVWVRQGCWLSTTIVVPPFPPLTTATLAPVPAAVETVSALAPYAELKTIAAPSSRLERAMSKRMVGP